MWPVILTGGQRDIGQQVRFLFGRIPSKEEADLLPDDRPHGSPELLARARNAVKREYKAPTKDQMSGVPQEEDSRNTVTTIENMSTIPGNSTNRQTNVY